MEPFASWLHSCEWYSNILLIDTKTCRIACYCACLILSACFKVLCFYTDPASGETRFGAFWGTWSRCLSNCEFHSTYGLALFPCGKWHCLLAQTFIRFCQVLRLSQGFCLSWKHVRLHSLQFHCLTKRTILFTDSSVAVFPNGKHNSSYPYIAGWILLSLENGLPFFPRKFFCFQNTQSVSSFVCRQYEFGIPGRCLRVQFAASWITVHRYFGDFVKLCPLSRTQNECVCNVMVSQAQKGLPSRLAKSIR